MRTSNFELIVREFYKYIIPDKIVLYNSRPDLLEGLELDLYFPELNLAVEVDGAFHRLSDKQKENDIKKNKLCKENSIELIRITHPRQLLKQNKKLKYSLVQKIKNYKAKKNKRVKKAVIFQNTIKNYNKIQEEETRLNKEKMISRGELA